MNSKNSCPKRGCSLIHHPAGKHNCTQRTWQKVGHHMLAKQCLLRLSGDPSTSPHLLVLTWPSRPLVVTPPHLLVFGRWSEKVTCTELLRRVTCTARSYMYCTHVLSFDYSKDFKLTKLNLSCDTVLEPLASVSHAESSSSWVGTLQKFLTISNPRMMRLTKLPPSYTHFFHGAVYT